MENFGKRNNWKAALNNSKNNEVTDNRFFYITNFFYYMK